jgi:plasmid stabilization system protein ParE
MKVDITSAAEADLEAIADYIARDNPVRALSFVRELYERCLDIGDMPEAWPVVPRYEHHRIRRRVHGRYLIFYRVGKDRIIILHVLNGAMDVDGILFPDG